MTVTIYQAKAHLPRILERVEMGEEVVVCRGNQPIALIVPSDSSKNPNERKSACRRANFASLELGVKLLPIRGASDDFAVLA